MVNNRRSKLDIIAEILDLSKEGTKKTNILYKGNLSYTQIQSYLPFLIEKDMLEECLVKKKGKNHRYYKITSKGLNLLDAAQKTLHLLE
jgi:predicted transcriptional regulator